MCELKCDFAMITETWFRGGKKLDSELTDIKEATGINIICKNRRVGNRGGATGGGVAIAVNTGRCNLKKRGVKSKHGIVCVVGKIGKIERQFAIYSAYVPPSTKAEDFTQLCEDLAMLLVEIKGSLKDPVFVVGRDFNNRSPTAAFEAIEGMQQVPSGPTRGAASLDLIFKNAPGVLQGGRAETYPPLETETGLASDHLSVWGA